MILMLRRKAHAIVQDASVFGFLVAAIVGAFATRLVAALDMRVFGVYAVLALGSTLLSLVLCRLFKCAPASAGLAVWSAAACWFCGLPAILAVVLMAAAAVVAGSAVAGRGGSAVTLAMTCGVVVIACASGWILTWPVHYRLVWMAVLAAIAALGRHGIVIAARRLRSGWSRAVAASPLPALAATTMAGVASTACWLPAMQADDLAYHLRLPAQLLQQQVYRPMPEHMVWAYSAWAGDTWHAIASVLAGGDARGAVNALWLLLLAAAAWNVAAVFRARAQARWLVVMLVCSVPMLGGLATGMHTELPASAIALALCGVAFAKPRSHGRQLLVAAILGSGLLALKLMHFYAALPLLLVAIGRHGRRQPWWRLGAAAATFLGLGLSAYAQSWWSTGNPVLPLFNAFFKSDFAAKVDLVDNRWQAGLSLSLPWDLTFHTARFLENGNGALGFALIALGGAVLLAMTRRRFLVPLAASVLMLLLPLLLIQYARYALPGVVCLMVVAAAAHATIASPRTNAIVLSVLVGINFLAYQTGNWLLATSALKRYVASNGDVSELYSKFLPGMEVLRQIPANEYGIVLATDPGHPYVARFGSHGRSVSWYDPPLRDAGQRADADASGRRWLQLLQQVEPEWLLVNRETAGGALLAALARSQAVLHAVCGAAELWRWQPPPGFTRTRATSKCVDTSPAVTAPD